VNKVQAYNLSIWDKIRQEDQKYDISKLNQIGMSLKYREEIDKILEEKPLLPNTEEEEWQNIKQSIQTVEG
jgi:hypothetical protein